MVTKPCVSSSGNFPESTHHMKIAGTSQMITMIDIRALVYSPVDEETPGFLCRDVMDRGPDSHEMKVCHSPRS